MTKALGFLAGVWLTIAVLILVLETLNGTGPELSVTAPPAGAGEEPAPASGALPTQGDVEQAWHAADEAVPPDDDSGTAGAERQDRRVPATKEAMPEEAAQPATAQREPADVEPVDSETDDALAPEPVATAAAGQAHNGFEASGPDRDHDWNMPTESPADDAALGHSADGGTHLFWSPFRSEWAARGFAGRLTASTQVPVQVVNVGPGQYRVAFSYRDETERLARIAHIETVTGLKLE